MQFLTNILVLAGTIRFSHSQVITLTQTPVHSGPIPFDTAATLNYTMSNIGYDGSLSVQLSSASETPSWTSAIIDNTCPSALEKNQHCTFSQQLTPIDPPTFTTDTLTALVRADYAFRGAPTINTVTLSITPPSPPTITPSTAPSATPSETPTYHPSLIPTDSPSVAPTDNPSPAPTDSPSLAPTFVPTRKPTIKPIAKPTVKPTPTPTAAPSAPTKKTLSPVIATVATLTRTTSKPVTANFAAPTSEPSKTFETLPKAPSNHENLLVIACGTIAIFYAALRTWANCLSTDQPPQNTLSKNPLLTQHLLEETPLNP